VTRLVRGLILSAVVGGVLYGALGALFGDLRRVGDHLITFPVGLLVAGLGLASLNYAFRFLRWQYYLALLRVAVPPLPSLGIFLAGFSLTVTPAKIGEVLKSELLRASYGVPIARTAPIVVAERLTDLLALLLLCLVGVSTWMSRGHASLLILGFFLCALLVVGISSRRLSHGAIDLLGRALPGRLSARLVPRLHEFYDATALLLMPRALLWGIVLALLSWFCECVAFLVVLYGFPGVQPTLLLATFIYSMMTVAGALAFVPGGLGVTEAGMIALLGRLCPGATDSVAVAATVIIRLVTLWFAVVLGVLALLLIQRLQQVRVDLDALKKTRHNR
jgi:uncharacterized protein (TIRG00374 family)